MKKNTQLAIQSVQSVQIANAKPKVSKSEAIKAAVERARILHDEKREEHTAKQILLDERVKAAAIAFLTKEFRSGEITDPEVSIAGAHRDSLGNVEIKFTLPAGSFGALLRENKKLSSEAPGWFYADSVEKQLKSKLDTSEERIALILKDEENVRVIDALLQSLK